MPFFIAQFNQRKVVNMHFTREFLEDKVFSHPRMRTIPFGLQSEAIHAFEDILSELEEENPYVALSELFTKSKSANDVSTESVSE